MKLKADVTNEIGVGRPRCGNGTSVILTYINSTPLILQLSGWRLVKLVCSRKGGGGHGSRFDRRGRTSAPVDRPMTGNGGRKTISVRRAETTTCRGQDTYGRRQQAEVKVVRLRAASRWSYGCNRQAAVKVVRLRAASRWSRSYGCQGPAKVKVKGRRCLCRGGNQSTKFYRGCVKKRERKQANTGGNAPYIYTSCHPDLFSTPLPRTQSFHNPTGGDGDPAGFPPHLRGLDNPAGESVSSTTLHANPFPPHLLGLNNPAGESDNLADESDNPAGKSYQLRGRSPHLPDHQVLARQYPRSPMFDPRRMPPSDRP